MKQIFTHKKIINSKILNFLGLQVLRILISRLIIILKSKEKSTLYENGYDVRKNFLEKKRFKDLKKEYVKAFNKINAKEGVDRVYGTVNHSISYLDILKKSKDFPNLINFFNNKKLRKLISLHERVNENELDKKGSFKFRLEKIFLRKSSSIDKQSLSNSDLHKDTFHGITKIIYYLSDVNSEAAPFKFIKKSHKIHWKILFKEWVSSFTDMNGSIRFSSKNMQRNSLHQKDFNYKSNTLIIADTGYGIHSRGLIKGSMSRDVLWLEYRRSKPLFF